MLSRESFPFFGSEEDKENLLTVIHGEITGKQSVRGIKESGLVMKGEVLVLPAVELCGGERAVWVPIVRK